MYVPTPPLEIRGKTGLKHFGGWIDEELHLKLKSRDIRTRTFKEMADNDAVVGAILFAIDMLIRQVSWTVEPASAAREDKAAAAFLSECLDDMSISWEETLSDILTFLIHGWSYHEICYKLRKGESRDPRKHSRFSDGRVGWRKIEGRSQDSLDVWEFDEEGGVQGMWQMAPPTYQREFISIDKALLFRTTAAKRSPEGRSVLRSAFRSWYFLRRIQELEAIGIERDLAGLPVLEVPPEMMHPDAPASLKSLRGDLEEMIAEVKRDEREGLVIPAEEWSDGDGKLIKTGYKFRLASTGGTRAFNTHETITRYEQRIATTVLADFILLGLDKVGSFALASSKTHLFGVALGAWLDSIGAVVNKHAIPRLFAFNDMRVKQLPKLIHGDIEKVDLTELSAFISNLAKVGVIMPDATLQRRVREMAELPEPEEDAS